jgi:hypothetical protein
MFDKVCNDSAINHLLTAPYSPTTTPAGRDSSGCRGRGTVMGSSTTTRPRSASANRSTGGRPPQA